MQNSFYVSLLSYLSPKIKQYGERIWPPNISVVRKLEVKFNAIFLPLDGIFAQAAAIKEAKFWLPDGVHPSLAGHALIAKNWLQTIEAL